MPKTISIIGSGNWASAIAGIIGVNVQQNADVFESTIKMWVYEEQVNGRCLSEIINTDHENPKYLPGIKLPANVKGVTSLSECAAYGDILLFVFPQQFVVDICEEMKAHVKTGAIGVSLIKGLHTHRDCTIQLTTERINEVLSLPMSVLIGANVAREIACGMFCESTIGTDDETTGHLLKTLFQADNLRIKVVLGDTRTVELLGALTNLIACAAGFTDGLGYGHNTKAAVFRLATVEMINIAKKLYPESKLRTFQESCGIAALIAASYGGRNRLVCEQFVKSGNTIEELEESMLNGQKLQGPHTAWQIYRVIDSRNELQLFPILTSIHQILQKAMQPEKMIDLLRDHPAHH